MWGYHIYASNKNSLQKRLGKESRSIEICSYFNPNEYISIKILAPSLSNPGWNEWKK